MTLLWKSFFLCVAICVFRLLTYANPAPHSLQLNGFSSLCILVLGGNTAPRSLQKNVFFLPRYVLPYVSSDDFPLQILHHTLSICLFIWPLQENTAPHSLSKKVCVATLQMTSLCKSCTTYVSKDDHFGEILPSTPCKKKSPVCFDNCVFRSCATLFAYVSLNDFPMKIFFLCVAICVFRLLLYANLAPQYLQLNAVSSLCILVFGGNTAPHSLQKKVFVFFFQVCVAICVFRWLPYANPAPHSLQLNGFSSLCILVCCFRLLLLTNPAPHSLQINVFHASCFRVWHLSWLFCEILTCSQMAFHH